MKKALTIIILAILLFSCKKSDEKEYVTELIVFGYSGYCLKETLNNTYTHDESWNSNAIELEYDSTRLDIREYFEYKKDSFIRTAIRRPMEETKYLAIRESDTIGLENLINKVLINKKFHPEYYSKYEGGIDDSWPYSIYYKTSKNQEFTINYKKDELPDSLKKLHDDIVRIIYIKNATKIKKFEYNQFTKKEAVRLFNDFPPPPSPNSRNRIKFIAPEIKGVE